MGFEQVLLADVKLEKPAPVPVGDYIFQLQPGASFRVNQKTGGTEFAIRFDIVEGDFAGRPVFVNYPDPASLDKTGKPKKWSEQALKKLEISLGVDALPGEDLPTYYNRVALTGHARVRASIIAGRPYTDKDGNQKDGDPQFGVFTVAPAA